MRTAAAAIFLVLGACAAGASDPETSLRIKEGMTRIGAAEERGSCLARGVTRRLKDEDEREAVRIVEESGSREEMRESVLAAKDSIRRAFIGANLGCSLAG